MKKNLCVLAALAFSQLAFAGNYLLTVDGKSYEIDLGEQKTVQGKNGKVEVSLKKKAVSTFTLGNVSFEHASDLNPAISKLDEGVNQILLAGGSGDLFLLQVYDELDGSILVPMLEKELIKEELAAGYSKTAKDVELKLDNGEILKGRFVQTQNKSDRYDRYILGCSLESGGIIAVVQTSDLEVEGQDGERMMKSLKSLRANCSK